MGRKQLPKTRSVRISAEAAGLLALLADSKRTTSAAVLDGILARVLPRTFADFKQTQPDLLATLASELEGGEAR